jgi:hypothetical protein
MLLHAYDLYKAKDFEKNFKGHNRLDKFKVPFQYKIQLASINNVKIEAIKALLEEK